MNKALLAGALIAGTLAPVAAQAQDGYRDRDHREWRDDRRDWRHDRRDDRRDWRHDRRDDRRDWREHRGDWRAPFAYRSFGVGAIAPREYWGSNYYYNNWRSRHLAAPQRGYYRYVRHYGDLLLIDTRSGRVISVQRRYFR